MPLMRHPASILKKSHAIPDAIADFRESLEVNATAQKAERPWSIGLMQASLGFFDSVLSVNQESADSLWASRPSLVKSPGRIGNHTIFKHAIVKTSFVKHPGHRVCGIEGKRSR